MRFDDDFLRRLAGQRDAWRRQRLMNENRIGRSGPLYSQQAPRQDNMPRRDNMPYYFPPAPVNPSLPPNRVNPNLRVLPPFTTPEPPMSRAEPSPWLDGQQESRAAPGIPFPLPRIFRGPYRPVAPRPWSV